MFKTTIIYSCLYDTYPHNDGVARISNGIFKKRKTHQDSPVKTSTSGAPTRQNETSSTQQNAGLTG